MRTSLVTSSPSDVLSVTGAVSSRGSELSIVNGMRTALPTTPNVGASRLSSSTSGSRDGAADRHGEHGNALEPQPTAASTGGSPFVPVAVGGQHDAAQVLELLRRLRRAARADRCRCPPSPVANG